MVFDRVIFGADRSGFWTHVNTFVSTLGSSNYLESRPTSARRGWLPIRRRRGSGVPACLSCVSPVDDSSARPACAPTSSLLHVVRVFERFSVLVSCNIYFFFKLKSKFQLLNVRLNPQNACQHLLIVRWVT